MKHNLKWWLVGAICLGLASPARAEKTLAKIQARGVLNVAIREDAAPFGYLSASNSLQGYCLDFFALLESQLLNKLERNSLSIKLIKSTASNRFDLVANRVADLECGPNTIRADAPKNTAFSNSFFTTGTQFLVRQNTSLDLDRNLDGAILGVIDDTTTAQFIAERYPKATLRSYRGTTARNRGVQAVSQGKIDAMISDGILLRAEAQQQELSSAQYPLIPDIPLTCDRYGIIVRAEDPEWLEFVNSAIDSPEAEELSQAWFGNLFSYIQPALDVCQ